MCAFILGAASTEIRQPSSPCAGITAMVIGQVQHISVEEAYAQGYELRYGKDGFMLLVPAPQDLVTGEPNQSAIATVHIEKYD